MGQQSKAKKTRRARHVGDGGKGGRPQAELTTEERAEFYLLLQQKRQIEEMGDTFDAWREDVAPRLMDIGIVLRKIADALELKQPTVDLYAKLGKLQSRALRAIDASPAAARRIETGGLKVHSFLKDMKPSYWRIDTLRAVGKTFHEASTYFTGVISPSDLDYRRQYRNGPRGPLPDLSMRYLANGAKRRNISERAIRHEIEKHGVETGIVPPGTDPAEYAATFEEQLRKAIRASDGK